MCRSRIAGFLSTVRSSSQNVRELMPAPHSFVSNVINSLTLNSCLPRVITKVKLPLKLCAGDVKSSVWRTTGSTHFHKVVHTKLAGPDFKTHPTL